VAAEVAAGRAQFVPKPFTPRLLTDKVAALLEARYRMAPGDPVLD
jgi:DNA-binding response OmpR family regulator